MKFRNILMFNVVAMPNLIHSLDASSIALLYVLFKKESTTIYTIHGCFAVTADKVAFLINTLKAVYIKMCSNDVYLIDLHLYIIDTINKTCGNEFTPDNKYIYIYKEKILYPSIM